MAYCLVKENSPIQSQPRSEQPKGYRQDHRKVIIINVSVDYEFLMSFNVVEFNYCRMYKYYPLHKELIYRSM